MNTDENQNPPRRYPPQHAKSARAGGPVTETRRKQRPEKSLPLMNTDDTDRTKECLPQMNADCRGSEREGEEQNLTTDKHR